MAWNAAATARATGWGAAPAAAPAGGGWGKAPAAAPAQYGAAAPAAGWGAPAAAAAPAAGGWGKAAAPAAGGYGAQPGYGAAAPAAGGFGKAPAAAAGGWGAAPAAAAAPAAGGWGKAPAAAAPAAGGWGKAPAGAAAAPAPGGPFSMHVQQVNDPKGRKTHHLRSITALPSLEKRAEQHMSPEMLAWDDWRTANNYNDGSQPMAQMCGFNLQAAAAPAAGGWGKAPAAAPAAGGFGKAAAPAAGGWGAPAAAAAAPAAGGWGKQAPAAGGFGQAAAPAAGGFGKAAAPAAGGWGAPAAAAPAAGGFGKAPAAAGGFGAAPAAAGGFGAAPAAAGGFGKAPAAAGGFGAAPAAGGFGKAPAAGGFGQPAAAAGGFGAAPAAGGFGAAPAAGGFGKAPAAGGFGAPAAGGFGQQPAAGGFGQQPAAGGFGQQPAAGGFGAPAAGYGPQVAATAAQQVAALQQLPDFGDKPYGNVLLYLPNGETMTKKEPADDAKAREQRARERMADTSHAPRMKSSYTRDLNSIGGVLRADASHQHASTTNYAQKAVSVDALRSGMATAQRNAFGTVATHDDDASMVHPTPARALNISSSMLVGSPNTSATTQAPDHEAREAAEAAELERKGREAAALLRPSIKDAPYDTTPSLAELATKTQAELSSVPHFEVRRRDGKCSVTFLEPVNLIRCVIDEVLVISDKGEVKLYPDGMVRPTRGEDLNVPARVVVNGVANISENALRARCRASGWEHESYNAQRQRWVYNINREVAAVTESEADDTTTETDTRTTRSGSRRSVSTTSATTGTTTGSDELNQSPVGAASGYPPPADAWTPHHPWNENETMNATSQHSAARAVARGHPPQPSTFNFAPPADATHHRQSTVDTTTRAARSGTTALAVQQAPPNTGDDLVLGFQLAVPPQPVAASSPMRSREPSSRFDMATVSSARVVDAAHPVLVGKPASLAAPAATRPKPPRSPDIALARSFRVGWAPNGTIAMPRFGQAADIAAAAAPEVSGARVGLRSIVTKPDVVALRGLLSAVKDRSRPADAKRPVKCVVGSAQAAGISAEKIADMRAAVQAMFEAADATCSATKLSAATVWRDTARQMRDAVALLCALYGRSDADTPASTPAREQDYVRQATRKELMRWLDEAVKDAAPAKAGDAPAQLLEALLAHDTERAERIAAANDMPQLQSVLMLSGCGNVAGPQIAGFEDEVDARLVHVVRLLAGETHSVVARPTFELGSDGRTVSRTEAAATWLQVLGVFAFYACDQSASAEHIIDAFATRLGSTPQRKGELALPRYARSLDGDTLPTVRGTDVVKRAQRFDDALFSLLVAFAKKKCPAPSVLHPHASSYFATDYTTAFITLLLTRAIGIERTEGYVDAEHAVLSGFALQLEHAGMWPWAVFVLSFVEHPAARKRAVDGALERYSRRAPDAAGTVVLQAAGIGPDRIGSQYKGRRMLDGADKTLNAVNAPGLTTVAHISRALEAFARVS